MRQTLVGVFERHDQAVRAAQALRDLGFGPVQVTDVHAPAAGDDKDDGADDSVSAHIRSFFAEIFGPTPDHHPDHAGHAELVRGGGALVRVDVAEESDTDAHDALRASGAQRVDRVAAMPPAGQP